MRETGKHLFILSLIFCLVVATARQAPARSSSLSREVVEHHTSFEEAVDTEADDPWSAADLIEPENLARLLAGEHKPAVLQVGISHLFRLSHIPGSRYA